MSNPDQSSVCSYSELINVPSATTGSYVRISLKGLTGGNKVTISSGDDVYSSTYIVPDSGRLFPEVRAGNSQNLTVRIEDTEGSLLEERVIGLQVNSSSSRVTNLRTNPGASSTVTSFTRPSGYTGVMLVRYQKRYPGQVSYNSIHMPSADDWLAGGKVVYTGSASSFTDTNLETGEVYYYAALPYSQSMG